jgi:probable HAF family extracellular repeat protein
MEQRAASGRSAATETRAIFSAITILSSVACGNADKGSAGEADTEGLRAAVETAGLSRAAHAPHCAPRAAQLRYRVTDMGSLASPDDPFAFVEAEALNESGQVVGTSHWPDANNFIFFRAFEWHGGVMAQLPTPDGMQSAGAGINESGTVVGSIGVPSFAARAVAWDGSVRRDLGTLGGPFSHAEDINDAGIIVGQAQIPGDDSAPIHAFVYANGSMLDLGTFGGTISRAFAINAVGQIVGEAESTVPGEMHAFLYEDGTMQDIFARPGRARDINDAGQIVGEIEISNSGFLDLNGVVYDAGNVTDLGPGNSPVAINNAGTVVGTGIGTASPESAEVDGFVVHDGKMSFLRDLIDACWHVISPTDINDKGQIIASARTCEETPRMRILLLDPVTVCGRGRGKHGGSDTSDE